jgi:dethiobiotin synthetase
MTGPILYVTGVNTGVGKTMLATLLLEHAREKGIRVAAMKPFCSGERDDAIRLHALQTAGLTLEQVNPFYFHEPLTPLLAARKEGRSVSLSNACEAIRKFQSEPLLIEGAGGLLSPLGEGFSLREIIREIPGKVCVVATNQLGCLNAIFLTLEQTGPAAIVLMEPEKPDASTRTNADTLRELAPHSFILRIPFNPPNSAVASLAAWWLAQ